MAGFAPPYPADDAMLEPVIVPGFSKWPTRPPEYDVPE
jgi:hypothetical protein